MPGKAQRAIAVLGLIVGMVALAVAVRAEDPEKERMAKESWTSAVEAYNADQKDTQNTALWQDYSAKFQQSANAGRAFYMVAESLYQQGFYDKAAKAYEEFLSRYPGEPFADSAAYRLGECAYNQKDYKLAVLKWTNLMERFPSSFLKGEALYGQLLANIALQKWHEANNAIERLSREYPYYRKEKKVKLPLGLVYYRNQKYSQALQYFQSIEGDLGVFFAGKCLENMGKYLPAAASYKNVLDNFPESIYTLDAAYGKADSYYKGENYPVAIKEFKNFVKNYPTSQYRPYALYKLAVCSIRQEDFASALTSVEGIATDDQRSEMGSLALYLKAECLRQLKKPDQAIVVYNQVINDYPNTYISGSAKFKAGWAQMQSGQAPLAMKTFREFLKMYPVHENVQLATYLLANSFFKQELYPQAVPIYQDILMKYQYSEISDAALAALEMSFYQPKQYEQLISTTHYILKVLAANFPPSKSAWRSLAYFYLGEAYYHMAMYSQAAGQYKKIVDNFSDSPVINWAKLGLSYSQFELDNYKESKQAAQSIVDTEDAPARLKSLAGLMIAHNLFNAKKYEEAIVGYEAFARDNAKAPESGDALFYAGQAYFQLEYYANAIDAWKKVVTYYKTSEKAPESAYKMADTFFKAQKYDEAIGAYQLLNQWPDDKNKFKKDVQLHVAQCYYNAKQDDKAILAYKKFIVDYPNDPKVKDAMEGIQMSYYRKGASADAIAPLMQFVTQFPKSKLAVDALYRVGEIYYQEKNYEQTIATFQQLIADYPEASVLPNAQYYVAVSHEGLTQKEKAIAGYKAFIQNFPTHELVMDVRFRLGGVYFGKEDYDAAIDAYQQIVDLFPKSDYGPNSQFNIALCYKKLKRWKQSIDAYTEFYKRYPNDAKAKDALTQIANTYREEKYFPSAIKIYEEMIANKDFADQKNELMYSVADSYVQLEKKEEAAKAFERMRGIKPRDDIYRLTALAKLGSLYEELKQWGPAYDVYVDLAAASNKPEWTQAAQSRMSILKVEHAADVEAFMKNKAPQPSVQNEEAPVKAPAVPAKPEVKKETKKSSKKK